MFSFSRLVIIMLL